MLFELLYQLPLLLVLSLRLLRQVLDLLHVEGLLLVVLRLSRFLNPCDVLLLLEGQIHSFRHFLLLSDHILPELAQFAFGLELDPFSFLDRLGEAFPSCLLSCGQFSLLLLDIAQFRVVKIVILSLILLQLRQICLQLGMCLLGELGLEHEATLGRLIKEVSAVSEAVIAELLGDALSVRSLRTLLDEVVQEA